jgi:hypothetical protein
MRVEREDRTMVVQPENRTIHVPPSGNDGVTEDDNSTLEVPFENRVMVRPPKDVIEMIVQPENRTMTVPNRVRRAA